MTPEQLRRDEAVRWLSQAHKDLRAAEALIGIEPSRSVFHSQQAAEKASKALLAARDVPFRKTHDLQELGALCQPLAPSLAPLFLAAEHLTDYAVLFRYLDSPHEPDAPEAQEALALASALVNAIEALVAAGDSL
jgi:HEPN domain-containing protein